MADNSPEEFVINFYKNEDGSFSLDETQLQNAVDQNIDEAKLRGEGKFFPENFRLPVKLFYSIKRMQGIPDFTVINFLLSKGKLNE